MNYIDILRRRAWAFSFKAEYGDRSWSWYRLAKELDENPGYVRQIKMGRCPPPGRFLAMGMKSREVYKIGPHGVALWECLADYHFDPVPVGQYGLARSGLADRRIIAWTRLIDSIVAWRRMSSFFYPKFLEQFGPPESSIREAPRLATRAILDDLERIGELDDLGPNLANEIFSIAQASATLGIDGTEISFGQE